MKNNLFSFATSELSQDAFICWCINWFNCGGKLKLLAEDLLNKFGIKNINDIKEIQIEKQFNKIDVLLILKGINTVVVIEDKTYTSEHREQIKRYNNAISEYKNNSDIDKNTEIISVYFKMGFFYDYDYYFHWRIDCNQKGPFIALKMYNEYNKKNIAQKENHISVYRKYKDIIKSIITKSKYFKWESIEYKKNTENCHNATFILIYFKDKLKNWEKEKNEFINNIRKITEEFIN